MVETVVAPRPAGIRRVILDAYDANEVLGEGFDSPSAPTVCIIWCGRGVMVA